MKPILFSLLVAAASSAHASSYGTVETVREIRREHADSGVLEHSVRPQTGDEMVVRLDDGGVVRVMRGELQALEPGTRVLVLGHTAIRVSLP